MVGEAQMSDKHTPGPWKAVFGPCGWYVDVGERLPPEVVEANTRLAAAAPQLLEAARLAWEFAKRDGLSETAKMVANIIAEATGESL